LPPYCCGGAGPRVIHTAARNGRRCGACNGHGCSAGRARSNYGAISVFAYRESALPGRRKQNKKKAASAMGRSSLPGEKNRRRARRDQCREGSTPAKGPSRSQTLPGAPVQKTGKDAGPGDIMCGCISSAGTSKTAGSFAGRPVVDILMERPARRRKAVDGGGTGARTMHSCTALARLYGRSIQATMCSQRGRMARTICDS